MYTRHHQAGQTTNRHGRGESGRLSRCDRATWTFIAAFFEPDQSSTASDAEDCEIG